MNHKPADTINLERFKELSDGERDGLLDLIRLYVTKTEEQTHELEKALKDKATAEVGRLAHSMVGANAMVGMESVVSQLRQVEEYAEKKDLSRAKRVFNDVQIELKRIQVALTKYAQTL